MIVFGTRMYGKVDQVPGLFHLATEFFHINFVPLGPTRSFLMLDGPGNQGIRVGLSGKSILFAYLRAFFVVVCAVALLGGLTDGARQQGGALIALSVAIGCVPLFFLTYLLSRPSPLRAFRLATQAGLPMGMLAEHYAKTLTPEQLEDLVRRTGFAGHPASPNESSP
jgi:hypothetical protein